ncbi:T9SS type A sorting domain-containing protein [candidate division WOR-3 bacterium]|nr:T9SS type A sorting domain-containing protein [candidate division WOR-3 bacterium]
MKEISDKFVIKIFVLLAVMFLIGLLPVTAQQFYEDWESAQWSNWELTGTQQTPPSGWTFEQGYNSVYSAQAKHYHSFGGWGGWTGIKHSITFSATLLDLYYYFDRSGNLDYASEKVRLFLSDGKRVEYWVDTYNCDIPASTDSIKYIDCTGGNPATWYELQRNIADDIAGFSAGQVTDIEFGVTSRGNSGGPFEGLMRADNILLIAEEDTIPPFVNLILPNGGESLVVGELYEICWSDSDNVGIIGDSLYYSTDGGTNWIPIIYQSGDPQVYQWTVPNTPSDFCKVKVVVFDWGDSSASDESDADFAIVPDTIDPLVTVLSPDGGEQWGTGEYHQITWEASDNVSIIGDSIYYSINGGTSWIPIVYQEGNPQSYTWIVPDTPSDSCRVKLIVFDSGGNSSFDDSNNNFTIFYKQPPPVTYAVVVKNSTYQDSAWAVVVDTLLSKYSGMVFTYETSVWEVQSGLSGYYPTHVGFVTEPLDAPRSFVNSVCQLMRALDDDPYGDAIWGVITGYEAGDALRVVTGPPSMTISTVILNDCASLLNYVHQGVFFNCAVYNDMRVKNPDGSIDTLYGPTDCIDTLVSFLNSDTIDIFMTAGHGNHDNWQRHFPGSGLEGFFRSSAGQLYGDPYSGSNVNVNSINPKICFNPYSCLVGKIVNMNSLVPAWFHTAGAYQYAGYLVTIGYCYNGKGVHTYLWSQQDMFSYAEAAYLSNQALLFDQINNTPGVDQGNISYERDEFAFYGDPAGEARLQPVMDPFYSQEFIVTPGAGGIDTVTFRITIKRDGHPWNYGGNPAFGFPSFDIIDPQIIYTNAHNAVVTDNFVLLNIWNQGDPDLQIDDTREVVFTAQVTGVMEKPVAQTLKAFYLTQCYPNPFKSRAQISYTVERESKINLTVYNILGQKIKTLVDRKQEPGYYEIDWNAKDDRGSKTPVGVYFIRLESEGFKKVRKVILMR